MGKDRFSIKLNGSTDSYYPGSVITGYLKMELYSPMAVKEIQASFEGSGYVEFTTGAGENAITFNATESYCFETRVLLDKGSSELQMGDHKYPFSFQLPKDVPSSFESFQASIRYSLTIHIERSMFRSNKVVRRIVNVINPLNLNDIKTENLMLVVVPVGLSLDLSLMSTIIIGSIPLVEVASRYGVSVPSAPMLSSDPTELYSDSNFTQPPQASFAESVFGDVKMEQSKKGEEEKDEEIENVPFVPKYLYYKWNN